MKIFLDAVALIVFLFGLLGPWAAGMAYNWNGWRVVWFTVFNVLVMAAAVGYMVDHP